MFILRPLATENRKFQFFSIIIDLQTPKNISALVWFRSDKKPGTSLQKSFFDKIQNGGKSIMTEIKSEIYVFFVR